MVFMMVFEDDLVQLFNVWIDCGGCMILCDVLMFVFCGSIIVVFGLFGSGKFILLVVLIGELCLVVGSVMLFGKLIFVGSSVLCEMCCSVGVLLQGNGLFIDLIVVENVVLLLCIYICLLMLVLCCLVQMKLYVVGLLVVVDVWLCELFGGMVCCVVLVCVLVLDLLLMIYDELLIGLDLIVSGVIMSLIQCFNYSLGLISIIVSYYVYEILLICDQVIVIVNGGIVFQGSLADLEFSQDLLLCQFLYGELDGLILFDVVLCVRVV